MKVQIQQFDLPLIKRDNLWVLENAANIELVMKDSETMLIITPSKVYTVRCIAIDRETKTVTLLYNQQKFNAKITEPLDEILKSMGLENALTPKISEVKAPMPGLVLQVLVNSGDTVQKGDKILVLEAMKMENAIKSPADGVVSEILVSTGNAVDKNQVLITFK